MAKLEDIIESLREQGLEDEAEELEKLSASPLRKKAQNADRFESELADAKAKIEKYEKGPKVRGAFEKAGIDFESLSKLERKALENYDGELDEDGIVSFIEENELSVDQGSEEETEGDEGPAAAKVAAAARKAGEARTGKTTVTPDDTEGWSTEKLLKFRDQHPEEFEALKQGETVTGVAV